MGSAYMLKHAEHSKTAQISGGRIKLKTGTLFSITTASYTVGPLGLRSLLDMQIRSKRLLHMVVQGKLQGRFQHGVTETFLFLVRARMLARSFMLTFSFPPIGRLE